LKSWLCITLAFLITEFFSRIRLIMEEARDWLTIFVITTRSCLKLLKRCCINFRLVEIIVTDVDREFTLRAIERVLAKRLECQFLLW